MTFVHSGSKLHRMPDVVDSSRSITVFPTWKLMCSVHSLMSQRNSDSIPRPLGRLGHTSPGIIKNAVPVCAADCLELFISSNFPSSVCPNHEDIECLCTHQSRNGLTLGEGATKCLLSSCFPIEEYNFQVYGVCSGIENALPNTHPALTATLITAARFPQTSNAVSTSLKTSTHRTSSVTSPPTTSMINSPSTVRETPEIWMHEPSITVGTVLPFPSSTASPMIALERGQIIGMSAGAAVVGAVLLGIIIFLLARRRRYKLRLQEESQNFEIGGTMSEPPKQVTFISRQIDAGPRTPIGAYNSPIVDQLIPLPRAHVSRSHSRSSSSRTPKRPSFADDFSSTRSPRSPASQTSTSQLLPKGSPYAACHSQEFSTGDLHAPKGNPRVVFEQGTEYGQRLSKSTPFSAISYDMARRNALVDTPQRSPDSATWLVSPGSVGAKSPIYGKHLSPAQTPASSAPTSSVSSRTLVNHELSPTTTNPRYDDRNSDTTSTPSAYSHCLASDDGGCTFQMMAPGTRNFVNRDSAASMTSFETAGSDWDRGTQHISIKLSPVKEYPTPKLCQPDTPEPGPSYQSPNFPRPSFTNPPSQSLSYPGNSLLAKRRGERFAGKLENGFTVPTIRPPPRGPIRGLPSNPRSATRPPRHWGRQIQQTPYNRWWNGEPSPGPRRITPTRDGQNLVLRFD